MLPFLRIIWSRDVAWSIRLLYPGYYYAGTLQLQLTADKLNRKPCTNPELLSCTFLNRAGHKLKLFSQGISPNLYWAISQSLPQPGVCCLMAYKRMKTSSHEEQYEAIHSLTDNVEFIRTSNILVVGAGGLGSEILKDLCMMGFEHIHIIDMDTIEISNLNRQLLFTEKDVGAFKASVAANTMREWVPKAQVTAHNSRIEDKDIYFYMEFDIIISGLDSISARRWINETIMQIYQQHDQVIPFIDGGTEGFKGHVRVIYPGITGCFECNIDMFPTQKTYPVCTLANTPRLPEHCVQYVFKHEWEELRKNEVFDSDNQEHVEWVYLRSKKRADGFGIDGISLFFTLGVVKNIIPAIASTNAIISAVCANETLKIALALPNLNNFAMYNGESGVYTHTFSAEKNEDCIVCSILTRHLKLKKSNTLQDVLNRLSDL
eukprot:NODE_252_length_12846_cov_0.309485.p1 type:complete len:433 gc:universal NODE_252_length_12846_cov_0.309485:10858-12156(+)